MRSRPDLTLYFQNRVRSGQTISCRIVLDVHSETPCNGIDVTLVGSQKRYKHTVSNGKQSRTVYHRSEVLRLQTHIETGTLKPGKLEKIVVIPLPVGLPPSFSSHYSGVEYLLNVRVDIPWWPDRNENYPLIVVQTPAPPPETQTRLFTSNAADERGEDPIIELALDTPSLLVGGVLSGSAAITGLRGRRFRSIELALVTYENALVHSSVPTAEIARERWVLTRETPGDGEALPFRFQLPRTLYQDFSTEFFQIFHRLELTADVAWGRNLHLSIPAYVTFAQSMAEPPKEEVRVGRERTKALWEQLVATVRLPDRSVLRAEEDRDGVGFMVGDLHVLLFEEERGEYGPCLVVEMEYPSLALGLQLRERRWTNWGGAVSFLSRDFQRRFHTVVREEEQLRGLLTANLSELLLQLTEVAMTDQQLVGVRKGGVYRSASLQSFVELCWHVANEIRKNASRIPAPKSLQSALGAFTRFAEEVGATLRLGDFAILGWTLRGVPLSLEVVWDGTEPRAMLLFAPRGNANGAQLHAALDALGKPVVSDDNDRIGIECAVTNDPRTLQALADTFARAVLEAGSGAAVPYR